MKHIASRKALYKQKAWYRLRWHQINKQPLCEMHWARGDVVRAQIVDHKIPHKGDLNLFLDADNLQSLCESCHNMHKQRQEKSGYLVGHESDGMPMDPGHHWYEDSNDK